MLPDSKTREIYVYNLMGIIMCIGIMFYFLIIMYRVRIAFIYVNLLDVIEDFSSSVFVLTRIGHFSSQVFQNILFLSRNFLFRRQQSLVFQ